MAKLVRSTKLSIQAPFFYTKGQREVEAQHPVVGMDTGLAHTYMDFKLTSARNKDSLSAQSPKGGDGGSFSLVGVILG
jgi:hypothetical protein